MLQETALRVMDAGRYAPPLVIANCAHADTIDHQLNSIGCSPLAVVLEPFARNTAPAIALAALAVDPDVLLLVMPSDHVIKRAEALHAAVAAGVPFARDGWLITFGITPTQPETGYGYIKLAEPLDPHIHRVARFIEKPSRPAAEQMLAEGGYAWNGGIFLFQAGSYLKALEQYAPDMLEHARSAVVGAARAGNRLLPDTTAFRMCQSESIDYAVMEKAERVAVVPVDPEWSDVGSWDALYELGLKDAAENMIQGPAQVVESNGCLVRSDGARVSLLGVSDLIVIATGDEIMILPRGRSQEVKRLLG